MSTLLGEPIGQTWLQLVELGLAFVLSGLIGLEREVRQKSAGLRTYAVQDQIQPYAHTCN